jgi:amidohydrolase
MDALPIQDRKSTAYSSKISGKMHACGHDAHTAILLGTAMVLSKLKDKLPGNVRFIFQPAEETTGGADRMIKEGALETPHVNAVVGLHMDENIPSGCIGIKYGQMNAASNPFKTTIKGKGAHGAAPHDGVDAIAISAQVISALQTIVSRETDPTDSAVVTIGMINGGNAPNIICDTVVLKGIIRTLNNTLRTNVQNRLCQVVSGITESMMGNAEIKIDESYPCLINDDAMTDLLKKSASEILGNDKIVMLNRPSLGVEDFAYFGQHVPSVFYRLGCRNEKKGIIHPAHGCFFDIDEDSLLTGVLVHCQTVIKYLFK